MAPLLGAEDVGAVGSRAYMPDRLLRGFRCVCGVRQRKTLSIDRKNRGDICLAKCGDSVGLSS